MATRTAETQLILIQLGEILDNGDTEVCFAIQHIAEIFHKQMKSEQEGDAA